MMKATKYCWKVYRWEDTLPCAEVGNKLSLKECMAFVRQIRKDHGLQHKRFPVGDGRGSSWARGGSQFIELPKCARNHFYIIHETAHSIVQTYKPDELHGPYFVGFLMHLLKMYKGLTYKEMEESAKIHGIEYHKVWRKLNGIKHGRYAPRAKRANKQIKTATATKRLATKQALT